MLDSTIAYGLDFLFPAADTAVGASLKISGEFSRVELDFMLAMAGETGTLIDVGANIGSIALPFARHRPGWRVTAIEASRALSGVLAANALNNGLYNVVTINTAAGAARAIVDFPAVTVGSKGNFGGIGFGQDRERVEAVAMLPLDEVSDGHERLVKIDVEGFEADVLKGATALLDRREAVWLVEASPAHVESTRLVVAEFALRGYRLYWLYVPFATVQSFKQPPVNPRQGDLNIVAVPPGRQPAWDLIELTQQQPSRPASLSAFTYLARYGYDLG